MAPGYGRAGKGYYTSARGYRSYYTGKFGSTVVGKAVGNAKAQRAGVKNNYFQTTVENVGISVGFGANSENSAVYVITPGKALDHPSFKNWTAPVSRSSPLNDKQFRCMCHMFDQVKIIGMKVQIQVTPTGANGAMVAPCTIGTLWNRSASVREVFDSSNQSPLTVSDIEGCGSCQVSSLGGYSRYSIKRSIYCRDLQEKSNWFDTNIVYDTAPGGSPLVNIWFESWHPATTAEDAPRNLSYFMPALYFYLKRGITSNAETWYMTVRTTYMCVFRNTVNRLDSFCVLNTPNYVNPAGRDLTAFYTSKTLPMPDKFTLSFTNKEAMPPCATLPEVDDDETSKEDTLTEAVKKEAESTSMEDDPGTM